MGSIKKLVVDNGGVICYNVSVPFWYILMFSLYMPGGVAQSQLGDFRSPLPPGGNYQFVVAWWSGDEMSRAIMRPQAAIIGKLKFCGGENDC